MTKLKIAFMIKERNEDFNRILKLQVLWPLYMLARVGSKFHNVLGCSLLGRQEETGSRTVRLVHVYKTSSDDGWDQIQNIFNTELLHYKQWSSM